MQEGTTRQRGAFVGEVIANELLCDEHHHLRLAIAAFPPSQPGQFVQLQCRPPAQKLLPHEVAWGKGQAPKLTQSELTGRKPLLRRPLSLAGRSDTEDGRVQIDIICRAVGEGTRWLGSAQPADRLSVLGPLGNSFRIFPDKPAAVLIGGGVAIAPMRYLAMSLAAAGKKTLAFSGVRSANLLPLKILGGVEISSKGQPTLCAAEFAAHDIATAIATDDGALGYHGLVSDAFNSWLDSGGEDASRLVVYCCGPEPMMQAVAEICLGRNIECQLAMERMMACGMGTCQSCVVKLRDETDRGWSYKLCCTDGPIFDAREVFW